MKFDPLQNITIKVFWPLYGGYFEDNQEYESKLITNHVYFNNYLTKHVDIRLRKFYIHNKQTNKQQFVTAFAPWFVYI